MFNSPFELGIRMVYLLQALMPHGADLQKLVLLDYAIVYSADLNGPSSLHTRVSVTRGDTAFIPYAMDSPISQRRVIPRYTRIKRLAMKHAMM
ncbi:ABC-three component system middle component 2 [Pseudomonas guariconensis]|uniref:ABC-three component system middle component 2 n=1 Tax=Pseudomonas guariconensis TaxID=1288410 RepID=UPI0034D7517F